MAKKPTTMFSRPFGRSANAKEDRFQPRANQAGLVVIRTAAEREKYSPSPSRETLDYIRRAEAAKSGTLVRVGRTLVG